MRITELFDNGEFVVSAEVGPPKGIHIDGMVEEAKKYLQKVNFVNVTDNQSSVMRLGSLATCKVLKDAGICNYSIFYCNDELFGYYECEKGVAYAEKVQAESPVVDRWNAYMKDILELEMDPVTGAQPKLEQVFRLN